jgi:hypothetical protein
MTYVGYIAHQLPDRVRIKVEAKRGDRAFFDRLVADLSAAPNVRQVRANPHASSVSVSFDPQKGPIGSALETTGLFQFREAASANTGTAVERRAPARPIDPDDALAVGLSGLGVIQLVNGEAVGPASENLWNAYRARTHLGNKAATLALTAIGLVQIFRGQYLNSASALFFYALTARQLAKERRAAERPRARRPAAALPPPRRDSGRRPVRPPAE